MIWYILGSIACLVIAAIVTMVVGGYAIDKGMGEIFNDE